MDMITRISTLAAVVSLIIFNDCNVSCVNGKTLNDVFNLVGSHSSTKINTAVNVRSGASSSSAMANTVRRHRNVQKDVTDDRFTNCPNQYSLFHCEDPLNIQYDIPCDKDTCAWDLSKLNAKEVPISCSGIRIEDPYAMNIPDIVKPCALWSILYGEHRSQSPTVVPSAVPALSPSFTNNDTAPAVAPVPATVSAPVLPPLPNGITYLAEDKAYRVMFDTVLINFYVTSSSLQTTKDVFTTKSDALVKLTSLTSSHIYAYLNVKMDFAKDLVSLVTTNYSSLSVQDPWNNGTILVSETLLGNVTIHEDYGIPRPSAITNMVKEAFELDYAIRDFLMDLKMSNDPTLKEIHHLYVGLPSEVIDTTTTTNSTPTIEPPPSESETSSSSQKDGYSVQDFGKQIEWGDWNDTYFLIFVSVSAGVVVMLLTIFALCYVLRRRVNKRQKSDLLVHNKSSSTNDGSEDGGMANTKESTENSETNASSMSALKVIPLATSKTTPIEDSNSKSSDDAAVIKYVPPPEQHQQNLISNRFNPVSHQIVQMDGGDDEYDDIQSDVYSYIDTNTVDDHCYSLAGALRYNPNIPGDEDDNNWSVAGGTMTGIGGGAALLNTSQSEGVRQTPQRTNTSTLQANPINLSGMISEESRNDNVVIFCDSNAEDDAVSLINDSMLLNTYDQSMDQQQSYEYSKIGSILMTSKPSNTISNVTQMSTNDRVAEVVAKLEGKTFLSNNSFTSNSTNATERTTNKNIDNMKSQMQQPIHHPSSGSRGDGTEGDPSSEGSVALSNYLSMPYNKDRQETITKGKKDEVNTKPPMAERSKSANVKSMKKNGQSVRAKPSFFRSTSSGNAAAADIATGSDKSWGIPTGESTNEKYIDNTATMAVHDDRKKGFWARTQATRSSKATQMVLGSVSSPSSVPNPNVATSPTETYTSPVSTSPLTSNNINNDGSYLPVQQIKLFEQYEESESDIQSICSFDDRSYFSFVKAAKGNTQLSDQERGSLRPPGSGNKNAYIPSLYTKKY